MNVNKFSEPYVAYCVPAHDVQPISDADGEQFDYFSSDVIYPSASAEYYTYPVDLNDPDFCDIITDLAQGELYDFSWGPSAVALPVEAHTHDRVSAVSIAVPESYVTPFNNEKSIVIPADAVNALEDDDFKVDAEYFNTQDYHDDDTLTKIEFSDQKSRRRQAVSRLKEKRNIKKSKAVVVKSAENQGLVTASCSNIKPKKSSADAGVVTARQVATSNRERVKGKFKQNKTRWVAVTEFLRQTHIRDGEEEANGSNNVYFPHAL
mmetsp:Transcript_78388/g.153903  ORF Transcript_78388/g.153903 Transcript_78388/m.153903 type:complete len:264 (-) Transcript_78388:256-1047(-)